MNVQPFSPMVPSTSVAATTSSASAALTAASQVVRIYNAGAVVAFVRLTAGTSTATVTDTPVAPGTVEVFAKGASDTASVILGSGTATVYFTCGEGQ